jgi:geranylgeranyl diphosphate synthase type II
MKVGSQKMVETKTYIKEVAERVHQELDNITAQWTTIPATLRESMRYSLLAGGKRIRPVLVLATVEALGGDIKLAMPAACAIEMVHSYSLVHDDLPAMDNDDYRRGKLTNHKVYDEATAILAGDALLTEAFGLFASEAIPAKVSNSIIQEAVRYAGARGMIAGQMLDLASENKKISLQQLEEIHRRKTGDLITFAVRTGAKLAGASEHVLAALTNFAYGLGLAFQIQDDILDVVGDQTMIGKPVGSDEGNNKATYPALLGLAASKAKLSNCIRDAKAVIQDLQGLNPTRLLELADYLLLRDR